MQAGFPAPAGMDRRAGAAGTGRRGLPRTRGDGPERPIGVGQSASASPHPRGWTPCGPVAPLESIGFPAPAGMDPGSECARRSGSRLPRTRGDGPMRLGFNAADAGASPHPRGWTPALRRLERPIHGFPAPAGMDPCGRVPGAVRYRLPRTRGDGPPTFAQAGHGCEASPHPRGWTPTPTPIGRIHPGFPAPAGMDPGMHIAELARTGLPRTRGDGPRPVDVGRVPGRASPHPRGWTLPPSPAAVPRDGFPAPAGMDRRRIESLIGLIGLPRTRGDGPRSRRPKTTKRPASPHPRGWTGVQDIDEAAPFGFPAPAGMDLRRTTSTGIRSRLPRTRGDGPPDGLSLWIINAASPHPRGWTQAAGRPREPQHGFPAPAGMDPKSS